VLIDCHSMPSTAAIGTNGRGRNLCWATVTARAASASWRRPSKDPAGPRIHG
jgi:N-formylglutamate amidohydrolase